MDKILLIVPAFNEYKNLPNLVANINNTKFSNNIKVDILIVNDFSTDNTEELLKTMKNIYFVNLPCNLGIGGAVQTGYKYAQKHNYDYAIQIDGDGQHNPEYINTLYEEIKKEKNFVIGSRFIEKEGFQSSGLRRMGINFFQYLIKLLTSKKITDATSGFRIADKKVISLFASSYPTDFPEPETIIQLLSLGLNVSEVAVVMNERQHGVSSINLPKSIYYMVKVTLAILFSKINNKKEQVSFE